MDKIALQLKEDIVKLINEANIPMYLKYYITKEINDNISIALMQIINSEGGELNGDTNTISESNTDKA